MSVYPDLFSYRKAWEDAERIDPPVPLNVDIELASTCNLRCPMCFIPDPEFESFISQKSDDGQPLRRHMPTEIALKIIDQCAEIGVPALKFNWRGESTLHKEYSRIVRYAADKAVFLELLANTNANCSYRAIEGLMACTKVMVSLDSMDPDIYQKMRVGGNLERAKQVISILVGRGHPNLWIRRVLTKLNEKENFFHAVKKEWGDKVKTSEHFCFDRNKTKQTEVSGCEHDGDYTERQYCGYPSQRIVIASTGLAYPCCIDLHETMPIGDLRRESIGDIWNGSRTRELRATLRGLDTKEWSQTCRNCESWMSYRAPQREFVQDKESVQIKDLTHDHGRLYGRN